VSKGDINLPAFETAATRVGSEIQLIPGNTMGYLHPKRDVIRVRMEAAAVDIVVMRDEKEERDYSMLPFTF